MRLSRLNDRGVREFRQLLESARQGTVLETPLNIISDAEFIEEIPGGAEFEVAKFGTRGGLALTVDSLLSETRLIDDINDIGLWAWLAAVFFDSICPIGSDGKRHPGKDYRYIPTTNWRDFYRHLVRGPVRIHRIFSDEPNSAAIVLCQRPNAPGDFVEQLASRQERITNPAIIDAANRLYYDSETGKPKRGAGANWRKPGTLRRFGDLLDQLDLTYDLYSMSADDLVQLLPKEFSTYLCESRSH